MMTLKKYVNSILNEEDDDAAAPAAAAPAAAAPAPQGGEGAPEGGESDQQQEPVNESGEVIYTVEATDREGKLKDLINYIMGIGNQKKNIKIVVDPQGESEKEFGWDGEGSDKIKSVNVENVEETPENTEAPNPEAE